MAIRIIEAEQDLLLTQAEYYRLLDEYQKAMMFYAGPHIPFEDWVRGRAIVTSERSLP